jgi:hypothetical protein
MDMPGLIRIVVWRPPPMERVQDTLRSTAAEATEMRPGGMLVLRITNDYLLTQINGMQRLGKN